MERGFTLIELLIVVAIIAILAAIAVPNFLEAQTRAKVSRVKTDLRTYATATETYTVDNLRPPPCAMETNMGWAILKFFTTPIAYLTSLPTDPFYVLGGITPDTTFKYYQYATFYNRPGSIAQMERLRSRGYYWVFQSNGPTRRDDQPWIRQMLDPNWNSKSANKASGMGRIYDPTNGTVSAGAIWRTNKGELHNLEN